MTQGYPQASEATATAALDLSDLRGRVWAGGVDGNELADTLDTVASVADDPTYSERVRRALANPIAFAAPLIKAAPRKLTLAGWLGAILLGIVSGLPLAYAALAGSASTEIALGDPLQAYTNLAPRWAAALVGVVAFALLLLLAARYRRPGMVGLLAGLAGGIVEVAVAAVPWAAISGGARTTCDAAGHCTVASSVPLEIALLAAIYFAIPFTLAMGGICAFVGLLLQRRRMRNAVKQAIGA